MSFELNPTLTCHCTRCGAELEDWEERTKGSERALSTRTASGLEFTVETRGPGCQRCGYRRLRVTFELGEPEASEASECDGRESSDPPKRASARSGPSRSSRRRKRS